MNNYLCRGCAIYALLLVLLKCAHASDVQGQSASPGTDTAGTSVPRWEYGLAAAALNVPAYPASASSTERSFLVPWFVYRGDQVRMQDGGIKLIAVENQLVTVDMSIAGSLNASSADAPLRAGMPELDYLLELGPKIAVRLFDKTHDDGQRQRLSWSTALRAAISTDFKSIDSRGGVLSTELRYRHALSPATDVAVSLGATWAGGELMDYLYRVDQAFALPARPAFDARGGFLGSNLNAGISHEVNNKLSLYIGLSNAMYNGARNSSSPLFERENTFGVFGGVSWVIKQSADSIRVLDE